MLFQTPELRPGDTSKGLRLMKIGDIIRCTRPGERLQKAIENGPFIDGLPIKNGDFPLGN